MRAVRSRFTFANVTSVMALVLAMAGGAYAVSGVPDSGGVFHGCVSNSTRVLRVVKSASSCHKPVRGRRHRDAGEFAISWNQQGRPGANGANGTNGTNGTNGVNGAARVVVRTHSLTGVLGASSAVQCSQGERAVAGGVSRSDGSQDFGDVVNSSYPKVAGSTTPAATGDTPTAWFSSIKLNGMGDVTLYVVCASP